MSYVGYVVDTVLLASMPSGHLWHASQSMSDPTKSLLAIEWENPNDEIAFESQPGVIPLGKPWEQVPTDAAAVLASFAPAPLAGNLAPVTPVDATRDTVAVALGKLRATWPIAGLVR